MAVLWLALIGCATERPFLPQIEPPPRAPVVLRQPLRFSILDDRRKKHDSEAVVEALRTGMASAYGSAFEWTPYFQPTPEGAIAIRIRLLACQAQFGSVLRPSTGVYSPAHRPARDSPVWRNVTVVATGMNSALVTGIPALGWWIGVAWVSVEVDDQRFDKIRFTVSLARETKEPNDDGYRSADRASRRAWGALSNDLIRLLDAIGVAVRDREARE